MHLNKLEGKNVYEISKHMLCMHYAIIKNKLSRNAIDIKARKQSFFLKWRRGGKAGVKHIITTPGTEFKKLKLRRRTTYRRGRPVKI